MNHEQAVDMCLFSAQLPVSRHYCVILSRSSKSKNEDTFYYCPPRVGGEARGHCSYQKKLPGGI